MIKFFLDNLERKIEKGREMRNKDETFFKFVQKKLRISKSYSNKRMQDSTSDLII